MTSKTFNEQSKSFYRYSLVSILVELNSIQKAVSTHHFEGFFASGKRHSEFSGKAQRPHLLKCLHTLHSDGLIDKIEIDKTKYQWSITEKGIKSI